jgi:hypothetical protein
MRLSATDKLYKKLSPTQAANLAFEAGVRHDDKERKAIMDSQPQTYFVGASEAYRRRAIGLTDLALFYGIVYWQARVCHLQMSCSGDNNAVTKILIKLGSLEQALIETCNRLGVDIMSIKSLSFCNTEYSFLEYADERLTAEYSELFMGSM